MYYYHVSTQLSAGTTIHPYGKTFSGWSDYSYTCKITNEQDFFAVLKLLESSTVFNDTGRKPEKWLCEILFENVRRSRFNNHTSRIYGTYLCGSIKEAEMFNEKYRENKAKIFIVELSETVPFYDMHLFTQAKELIENAHIQEGIYTQIISLANEYWIRCNDDNIIEKEYIYGKDLVLGKEITK